MGANKYLLDNNLNDRLISKLNNSQNLDEWVYVSDAMQAYAKQQQEIAVEKALEMASENANIKLLIGDCKPECEVSSELMARVDKQSILSLKPEILKELEK